MNMVLAEENNFVTILVTNFSVTKILQGEYTTFSQHHTYL